MARFPQTYCSQCGGEFGPGDQGHSHCKDHMTAVQVKGGLIASVMDYGRAVADELPQRMQQSWLDDIKEKLSWLETNAYAEGRKDEAEVELLVARVVVDTIHGVEARCMAADGPVTPTCDEITDSELRVMYEAARAAIAKAEGQS